MNKHSNFTTLLNRLGLQLPAITWMAAQDDQYSIAFQKARPENVQISYLLSTDPNDYLVRDLLPTTFK
jgi:hypothetical protein